MQSKLLWSKTLMNRLKYFITLISFIVLSSCQSGQELNTASPSVIRDYTAMEINITKASDFSVGNSPFLKSSREFNADQFIQALRDQLPVDLKYSLIGKKPARVDVFLHYTSIASSTARELSGEGSVIKATGKITDLDTGQVIASTDLFVNDAAARNSSNIGGVPVGAIASYVENKNAGSTVIRARDGMLKQIRTWLTAN